MAPEDKNLARNCLLRLIPDDEYDLLRQQLMRVELVRGEKINRRGQPHEHLYFIESGIVSFVVVDDTERRIEVGVCGNEAFASKGLLFGSDLSGWDELIQYRGEALAIPADNFRALIDQCPELKRLMLKSTYAFMVQTACTNLATGYDVISKRLARWLLMCQDRIGGPEIELTHEFLSIMLGVRRPGVTDALHELEGLGLVRAERGRITVLDREGIRRLAGPSMEFPKPSTSGW